MGFKCIPGAEIRRTLMKHVAIVLAAGRGKRMGSDIPKQYLLLGGHPVLYYSLKTFEESFFDEIILVTAESEIEYCKKNIVEKYNFQKVKQIVAGGAERYHSVYAGLQVITDCSYVYIHDGARPFITQADLFKLKEVVEKEQACVAAMPVKDTIKQSNNDQYVESTPPRNLLWAIQTPQVFSYELVFDAYRRLMEAQIEGVTDDAMVVEAVTEHPVKLVETSYRNIKITTPEDLIIGEAFVKNPTN